MDTFPSIDARINQAALNGQGGLIIVSVPAGGNQALIGKYLVDAGQLTVTGVYRCIITLSGMVDTCQVFLTATFGTGTVTSDLDTLYWTKSPLPADWTKKTAGVGDGALTTTVLQSSSLSTLAGEQFAVCDITLATAAACTFTRAEYCGK